VLRFVEGPTLRGAREIGHVSTTLGPAHPL